MEGGKEGGSAAPGRGVTVFGCKVDQQSPDYEDCPPIDRSLKNPGIGVTFATESSIRLDGKGTDLS
jgi:hypothetical protein